MVRGASDTWSIDMGRQGNAIATGETQQSLVAAGKVL